MLSNEYLKFTYNRSSKLTMSSTCWKLWHQTREGEDILYHRKGVLHFQPEFWAFPCSCTWVHCVTFSYGDWDCQLWHIWSRRSHKHRAWSYHERPSHVLSTWIFQGRFCCIFHIDMSGCSDGGASHGETAFVLIDTLFDTQSKWPLVVCVRAKCGFLIAVCS